jgi:hypothetical protein
MVSQAEYNLTSSELSRLKELLKQNDSVFSKDDVDIGEFKEVEHSIDTGSADTAFFRRVYGLSVGLKTHKVGLPSWKKHLGTSSGP